MHPLLPGALTLLNTRLWMESMYFTAWFLQKSCKAMSSSMEQNACMEQSRLARGTHHLVITLYDVKTSERINDAKVTATVTPLGLAPETKTLEVMKINNTISYGNYFGMSPGNAPYRVELSIKRPTDHVSVTTEFEYRQGASR